jgi:(p)ppGpp synthase/HD superfamily hydrolase
MIDQVALAMNVATMAHQGQHEWGGSRIPYVGHPFRVAAILDAWECATTYMTAAAYLHDVLTHTSCSASDIEMFGVDGHVIELLFQLEKMQLEALARAQGPDENVPFPSDYQDVHLTDEAKLIMLIDRMDDVRSLNKYRLALHELHVSDDYIRKFKGVTRLMIPMFKEIRYEVKGDILDSLERDLDFKEA